MRFAPLPRPAHARRQTPGTALGVVATQVSTTAKAGAPHGAATMPDVAPSRNTAAYDPPPRPDAHASSRRGAVTGNTSNIANPNSSRRFPMANRAHGLEEMVPNSEPVMPASKPSRA